MENIEKEYNQWYWKLYRYWKWDFKHLPRDIIQGFKNLWKWLPIIYKDRDWDNYYIFEVLKFKLKNTANYLEKHNRYVGVDNDAKYIRICERLISKLQDEYYQSEYFEYYDFDVEWLDVEDNKQVKRFKSVETKNELIKYFTKYPNTYKKVRFDFKCEGFKGSEGIALTMGIERHLKARKLLFKIIEDKIEGWWD